MNVDDVQFVVEWQVSQVVGNLDVACFGFVVELYVPKWQLTHVVGIAVYPVGWQLTQATPICAPVNGKVVAVLWLNVDGTQVVVVWHV